MESFVYLGLFLVFLAYGILLVLAPLALRFQFRYSARVVPHAVSLERLPHEVRAFIQPKVEAIEAWGFDLVNYVAVGSNAFHRGGTYIALLSNPHTREWAEISCVASGKKSHGYTEFITHCSDDVEVSTNTNAVAPVLFPTPKRYVFRLPQIQDVFTLYRAHRMLAQENVNGGYAVLPPHGQELTELQRRLERYGPWQRARGYMYLDARDDSYRLTWKGAFLGGWRSIWPWPLLRTWQAKREGAAILRRVGLAQQ